jgi:hypothetical protein
VRWGQARSVGAHVTTLYAPSDCVVEQLIHKPNIREIQRLPFLHTDLTSLLQPSVLSVPMVCGTAMVPACGMTVEGFLIPPASTTTFHSWTKSLTDVRSATRMAHDEHQLTHAFRRWEAVHRWPVKVRLSGVLIRLPGIVCLMDRVAT